MTPETTAALAAGSDTELEPSESPAVPATSPAPADTPPAPADSPEGPSPDAPPAPEGGEAPPAEGGEAPPAEPAEPENLDAALEAGYYEPFTFRAEGRDWTYNGAVQDDDGNVLFTPAAVRQLQRDLAFARDYPRRTSESGRELSRERAAREAAEATTSRVLAKFEELFEQSQGATTLEELMDTPLGKWVLGRHAEWPKLRADALKDGFDRKSRAQQEELDRYRQQESDTRQRPVMVGRVEEAVQHWAAEAGLDEAAQRGLIEQFTSEEMLETVFPRARQDDPATGVKAGQRYENLEVIRREMLFLHNLLKTKGPRATAAEIRAENDRRTGKAGVEPPPIAGGKKGTGGGEGAGKTKFKNTKEADEAIWG